ncbi:hypothetical protein P872_14575 [Rhodonellum psychrophilum GCM71 = DSM 17998]|uniref:Uncharacterized protein n=1 Tax=Rhodonellum psychrophilum GCM71 = DSM 17998 TaxID=1123057 RepID=U5C2H9_9BACT|nr:hypothetical protein P872_14575 [Rhodonellum psychrophilum GCM71 = DSM 17998]
MPLFLGFSRRTVAFFVSTLVKHSPFYSSLKFIDRQYLITFFDITISVMCPIPNNLISL